MKLFSRSLPFTLPWDFGVGRLKVGVEDTESLRLKPKRSIALPLDIEAERRGKSETAFGKHKQIFELSSS